MRLSVARRMVTSIVVPGSENLMALGSRLSSTMPIATPSVQIAIAGKAGSSQEIRMSFSRATSL